MEIFILFLIYSIPIWLMLFVLIHKPARKYYVPVKTLGSIAFLVTAVYCGVKGKETALLISMLPGFVMCLCGDVVLGVYNRMRGKKFFLAGVLAFLLGHLFFIRAFLKMQAFSAADLVFPVAAIFLTVLVTRQKKMFLGKMRLYVYVYSFFVALMFSKSIHIMVAGVTAASVCRGIGAGLFLISDFLILFLYFYDKRPWSTHGWNLATYYYGMFFLALSLLV